LYVPFSQQRPIISAVLLGVADRFANWLFQTAAKHGSPLPLILKNRTVA
jgi:hypothetical protein